MANPSKVQDPSAAAMSAIEEALNLADPAPQKTEKSSSEAASRSGESAPIAGGLRPRLPSVKSDELGARAAEEKAAPPRAPATLANTVEKRAEKAEAPMARPAANDDRQSVGQILQALQARPSRTPLVVASIASIVWLALAAVYLLGAGGETAPAMTNEAIRYFATLMPMDRAAVSSSRIASNVRPSRDPDSRQNQKATRIRRIQASRGPTSFGNDIP